MPHISTHSPWPTSHLNRSNLNSHHPSSFIIWLNSDLSNFLFQNSLKCHLCACLSIYQLISASTTLTALSGFCSNTIFQLRSSSYLCLSDIFPFKRLCFSAQGLSDAKRRLGHFVLFQSFRLVIFWHVKKCWSICIVYHMLPWPLSASFPLQPPPGDWPLWVPSIGSPALWLLAGFGQWRELAKDGKALGRHQSIYFLGSFSLFEIYFYLFVWLCLDLVVACRT